MIVSSLNLNISRLTIILNLIYTTKNGQIKYNIKTQERIINTTIGTRKDVIRQFEIEYCTKGYNIQLIGLHNLTID